MNADEQRDAAIAQVSQAIEEQSLTADFGDQAIQRFLDFLQIQPLSVAEVYAQDPSKIRPAIANSFTDIPDDADASIMPVQDD